MMSPILFWSIFAHFFLLSFLSIGGFMVTVPDIYRWVVQTQGLISTEQFNAAIALGQASPGPNVIIVWVLGWFSAGPLGAVAALVGTAIPFSCLSLVAGRTCRRYAQTLLIRSYRAGMAPVSIALLFASGVTLTGTAPSPGVLAVVLVTALLIWKTRVHTVILITAGALIGAMGWL